ncbi:hypothetical protein [Leptospira noguchii]|uniref:hypothetical protein n=1 Tax=Leptospira noguchii TaxID=28182 RepID=UPI001FB6DA23|nr:hypothetical protein [Leptospira noguchii]UOG47575.1 hypothetical protein MAL00_10850 [Leptospira noguchii]
MCSTILETKVSRFYWRSGNSASHSPWIVRRVIKVKIIILRMFKFIFPIKAERKGLVVDE